MTLTDDRLPAIDLSDVGRVLPSAPAAQPSVAKRRNVHIPFVAAAIGICLAALLGSAWVATVVFDRLPHVEDDVAFVFQAKTIASGQLIAEPPPLPDFFSIPFVIVQDDQWFGKYPPGYPLMLALGELSGHSWLFNPVLGAIVIGLLIVAGWRLYSAPIGLLAAALLTSSPFFLLQAGSFMSHVAGLFWAMVFLLLFDLLRRRRSPWIALAAGVAIGMLFLSRPLTSVGIGVPFAVWAVIEIARDWRWLRYYLPVVAGFIPFVLMMLAYNQTTTGDPFRFGYELWWPYDKAGFGEGIGLGGRHTVATGWFHTKLNLDLLYRYIFGWPGRTSAIPMLIAFTLAAGVFLWRGAYWMLRGHKSKWIDASGSGRTSLQAWDLLLAGVVVSLIAVHLAYWTPGQMYGPRYYFEAMGAIALLSARGIWQVAALTGLMFRWLLSRRSRQPRSYLRDPLTWTTGAALLVVAGLVAYNLTVFAPEEFRAKTDWYDINADGVRVVERADLHHALVFVEQDYWTDYAPFFVQNEPSLDTDIVYARDLGPRNRELMALYPDREYYLFKPYQVVPLQGPDR